MIMLCAYNLVIVVFVLGLHALPNSRQQEEDHH